MPNTGEQHWSRNTGTNCTIAQPFQFHYSVKYVRVRVHESLLICFSFFEALKILEFNSLILNQQRCRVNNCIFLTLLTFLALKVKTDSVKSDYLV